MLDCVQCSSIVFNLHYVHVQYFSFSLIAMYNFVHIYSTLVVFIVAQADGGKGVEERGRPAEECLHGLKMPVVGPA